MSIFRSRTNWKRYVGTNATDPPPTTTHNDNINSLNILCNNSNIVNNIEINNESDSCSTHASMPDMVTDSEESDDIDITINDKSNNIKQNVVNYTNDIILTDVKTENINQGILSDKDKQPAYQSRTTQHKLGQNNYVGTGAQGNGSYDTKTDELSYDDSIKAFVDVLTQEKLLDNYINDDDNESVMSETRPSFHNINYINHYTSEIMEGNYDNNIKFEIQGMGLGKSYIGGASRYPPYLDKRCTLGAYHTQLGTCTNVIVEDGVADHHYLDSYEITELEETVEAGERPIYISNTNNELISDDTGDRCIVRAINQLEFVEDEVDHVLVGDEIVVKSRTDRWHVHVPIRDGKGKIKWIYLFADPGANVGCVRSDWAWAHYGQYVRQNTRHSSHIRTPGGAVVPKYVLWMTFPAKSGKIIKVRMYLIDELPVDILADINMLKAFGYSFKDETPPFFRHPAEPDVDLELKEPEEQFKIHNTTEFEKYQQSKQSFQDHSISVIQEMDLHNKLYSGSKLLYSSDHITSSTFDSNTKVNKRYNNINVISRDIKLTEKEIDTYYKELRNIELSELKLQKEIKILEDSRFYHNCNLYLYQSEDIIDLQHVDKSNLIRVQTENQYHGQAVIHNKLKYINQALRINHLSNDDKDKDIVFCDPKIDRFGNIIDDSKIWHKCMLIVAKQSFIATTGEENAAMEGFKDKVLEFNDLTYLKEYPSKYGNRFDGLYEGVMKLISKYHSETDNSIFAKTQFSRKTMNVTPARLGIKPEFRGRTMFAPQYPINAEKRKHMIRYTKLNEENNFWFKIKHSLHCVPYTMVPKRKNGVIYRYRPAFDGRVVNQYCQLMDANMPTIKDIDDLHSIPGFVTCADVKNCFDCIPLDERDQKYAVCLTPLGLYRMRCLTYGWMNAAPEAQKIMNNLALHVGNTLAYIDDIAIKHPIQGNTQDILDSIERLFKYCQDKNIQLHPGKFFPACTESEGFSFVRTLEGTKVGEPYIKKILAIAKPTTVKQLQEFIGVVSYIGRFIYHKSLLIYWLNDLITKAKGKGKIKWTREADLCYNQLLHLISNSPLLYNPTKDGQFCLKTDACNYGIGAVLYQQQKDKSTGDDRWVIVDMWSKTMPTQLRHCHSMVHEAYAIVHAMEHWQFYLMKKQFKLSTDNNPVAHIFTHKYRDINPITQRQLLRLRSKITMFDFVAHHVPGINNELADSLSRFTTKLLDREGDLRAIEPIDSTDTNNKPLTEKDIESLDLYLKQGKQLKQQHKQLSMDKSFHSISTLSSFPTNPKFDQFVHNRNANWINILHDYYNHANYLEAPKVKEYLNSANDECEHFNEFHDPSFIKLKNHITQIAHDIYKLPHTAQTNIALQVKKFNQHRHQQLYNKRCQYTQLLNLIHKDDPDYIKYTHNHHNLPLAEQKDNHQHPSKPQKSQKPQKPNRYAPRFNLVTQKHNTKDDYHPETDLKYIPRNLRQAQRTEGMVTRSMAKKKLKQEQLKNLRKSNSNTNDPLFKEQEKELMKNTYDFINAEFNRTRFRAKTRDEFLFDVFGHRRNMNIFNIDDFKLYQENDRISTIAKRVIANSDRDFGSDDWKYLYDNDLELARKIDTKDVEIDKNNELLIVRHNFDKKGKPIWLYYVPFAIRGKMMDYYHHNLQLHHFEYNQTYDQLKHKYWWGTMKSDVRKFCETCISCQFIKGSVRHRAPLRIRELPQPRTHIFADFLGPIYKKYHILVMVDYATGYTMLIPTTNVDAQEVVNAILENWVKIFGWFDIFESDWGSGFNNNIIEALTRAANIKLEIAEPRNHRSIGKVERTIGFIQSILNQYNVLLGDELIKDKISAVPKAWEIIQIILPFIQLSINQKRSRFTSISPNMMMLGSNVKDASDIGDIHGALRKTGINVNVNSEDFLYVESLFGRVKQLNEIFKNDWKDRVDQSRFE